MKVSKTDWLEFWQALPESCCLEETSFPDVEDHLLPDELEGDGVIRWDFRHEAEQCPCLSAAEADLGYAEVCKVFRRWNKARGLVSVTVSVPVEHKDALLQFAANLKS